MIRVLSFVKLVHRGKWASRISTRREKEGELAINTTWKGKEKEGDYISGLYGDGKASPCGQEGRGSIGSHLREKKGMKMTIEKRETHKI